MYCVLQLYCVLCTAAVLCTVYSSCTVYCVLCTYYVLQVPLGPEFSSPGSNKGSYWTIEPSELKIQKDWTLSDSDQNFIKKLQGGAMSAEHSLSKLKVSGLMLIGPYNAYLT